MTFADASHDRPELEELNSTLREITGLEVDADLVRSGELGNMNFNEWRDEFDSTIELGKRLSTLRWGLLTPQQVQTMQGAAVNLRYALTQVQTFDLSTGGDLQQEREQLASSLIEVRDALLDVAVPLIGYISWESVDINSIQGEMRGALEEARRTAGSALDEIDAMREDASKALDAMREASIEAGVAHHSETFAKAAVRHESNAKRWVIAAICVGLATILAGILLVWLWESNGDISDAGVLQIVLIKAVVLSVGFYATVTCVRLYRSNAHLAVINRHREDSLRTFRAFVEGAGEDSETKAKVLLEATHAAFGHVPTGLATEGGGTGVIEVLDGVTGLVRRTQ